MELARITPDLRIEFPSTVKEWLRSESELAVFLAGDTLVLKKISTSRPSSFADRKAGREMSMEEIVAEVHQYREDKSKI